MEEVEVVEEEEVRVVEVVERQPVMTAGRAASSQVSSTSVIRPATD